MIAAVQRWTLRIGAIALPLIYWPFTYDAYVLPKLLFARALVLALGVLLIARWLWAGRIMIRRAPLDIPLLVFIASAVASTLAGVNINVGLFGVYTRYDGTLTLITYAVLFWLAVQSLDGEADAATLLRLMLAGAYGVSLVAIGQWLNDTRLGVPLPRAYGTMGNANVLGAYLVLLLPTAYGQLREAHSTGGRILAANALVIMGLALLMTVSHSAWLAVAVAAAILIAGRQLPGLPPAQQVVLGLVAALVLIVGAPVALSRSTDIAQRLGIWRDSLQLIAARPILGYGPDTFGLVYPQYQTSQWVLGYPQIDKAHSELLQVAATQGLVGLAAYVWLLGAFARTFWRGRQRPGAWPMAAGAAAYFVVLFLNFTALASAFPFWIFAAVAMVRWGGVEARTVELARARVAINAAGVVLTAALLALAYAGVVRSYLADQYLHDAVQAQIDGKQQIAAVDAQNAWALATNESVYASEVGNVAFDNQQWQEARTAYEDAVALGTFNPRLYRNLAVADRNLGLRQEAIAAARQAVYLDRFDPANQALLAEMLVGS